MPAGLRDGTAERTRTGGRQNSASTTPLRSPRATFAGKPHILGTRGALTLHPHQFARDEVVPLDHLRGVADGRIRLAPDLYRNLVGADQHEADVTRLSTPICGVRERLPWKTRCRYDGLAGPRGMSSARVRARLLSSERRKEAPTARTAGSCFEDTLSLAFCI